MKNTQASGKFAQRYPKNNLHETLSRVNAYFKKSTGKRTRDPTRAKPLIVLGWVKINVQRMFKLGALLPQQHAGLSELSTRLVATYNGIDKVQSTVLPLPYCP